MAYQLGLATVPKWDSEDNGSVTDTITLVTRVQPPPRTRVRIDARVLGESLAVDALGIEAQSDYVFTYLYEANDTQHAAFRTAFAAKTQTLFNLTYQAGDIEQFDGKIVSMVPQPAGVDDLHAEEITVHRAGAIAYS